MKAEQQGTHPVEIKGSLPIHGELQRATINEAPVTNVPPIVHEVLRSPGQPLDVETRSFFEPSFGHDFSGVRVHTDAKAAESARAVNALAYASGSKIVFGSGQYQPNTNRGQLLLAHELTHILQLQASQSPTGKSRYIQRADNWTLNELLELGPTQSFPESSEVARAQRALKSGNFSSSDLEILVKQAVEDFRATEIGETGPKAKSLSSKDLIRECLAGRDVSVTSLGTLVRESPFSIKLYRFQAESVFEGVNQHAFAVVVFPDGTKYLIDPTFSQFMTLPGEEASNATANVLRDGGRGEQMAKELINKGYIRLDKETAQLYTYGLSGPKISPDKWKKWAERLMTGEKAMLSEELGRGRGTMFYVGNKDAVGVREQIIFIKQTIRSIEKAGDRHGVAKNLREYVARMEQQVTSELMNRLQQQTSGFMEQGGRTRLMAGGGLMLAMAAQAYLFGKVQQIEFDKAANYYERKLRSQVASLNAKGLWVAVIAVMDVPEFVDAGSLLTGYKEIREINHFVTLYYQTGETRLDALSSRSQATIGPASGTKKYSPDVPITKPPKDRKWIDTLWLISPPYLGSE